MNDREPDLDPNLHESYADEITKWLSCNGEAWGVGPTAVFAAAAALFLHHELQASLLAPGDQPQVTLLEKTLIASMMAGTLALMVHVWVCLMRFFQYYLDTLIRDSPNVLLEMTTAGLLGGGQAELAALGPLTRFLRQQQPQVHITVCWLLALCYADYVRKHCCSFNVPYLEQWQAELHEQARRRVRGVLASVSSCAGAVHARLRGFAPPPPTTEAHTGTAYGKRPAESVSAVGSYVSRGDRLERASEAALARESEREVSVHNAADTIAAAVATAEAFEKLRAYINATRCACSVPGACSGAIAGLAPSEAPGTPGTVPRAAPQDGAPRLGAPRSSSMQLLPQHLPAKHKRSNTL